ncbi:hypothetical protein Ae201684P_000347 [Aphanomyces euteiches]|uniref:HSF-type DNA-binding domain-containing protein n=1 Tax=Aphanomyces euteiches TaxID=100861 RepID=A0A6G0XRL8_9STRA|nr:hypothetical protein Ae201684_002154 [Aphanomyces euteiches]KAH9086932.1 hypothetical protein Ae201684P_000347 [Aphanomyces euteiches]KAH9132408.1 hypothetical protein AeRB84_021166 [Aphanomyces euteiches]
MSDSTFARSSPKAQLSTGTPPFLASLFDLLSKEDPAVIRWCEDGKSFGIFNVAVLEAYVLPTYYRHNNFSSFQRQLNYFGFRRILKPRMFEPGTFYAQPFFLRDDPSKMLLIKRKTYRFKGARSHRPTSYVQQASRSLPLQGHGIPPVRRRSNATQQQAIYALRGLSRAMSEPSDELLTDTKWRDGDENESVDDGNLHSPDKKPSRDDADDDGMAKEENPFEPIPFEQNRGDEWKVPDEDVALLSSMMNPSLSIASPPEYHTPQH